LHTQRDAVPPPPSSHTHSHTHTSLSLSLTHSLSFIHSLTHTARPVHQIISMIKWIRTSGAYIEKKESTMRSVSSKLPHSSLLSTCRV